MTNRLLVTGGSGFIGRHVVRQALDSGNQVLNVDLKCLEVKHQSYNSTIADIRDASLIEALFQRFEPTHVLHLASDTDITLSDPDELTTVTVGSRIVFQAVSKQPTVQRLVHTSTQFVVKPGVRPQGERHYRPYTAYGLTKARSEQELWKSDVTNWVIARPTIVWGPHHPTFGNDLWMYLFRRRYLHPASRQPVFRTYGYVENVASQMIGLLQAPPDRLSKKVYYLGDGNLDYAKWIDAFSYSLTGLPARRAPKPGLFVLALVGETAIRLGIKAPYNLGRYFRMTTGSTLDLAATFDVVGLPAIDLQTGVDRTVEWLMEYWHSEG